MRTRKIVVAVATWQAFATIAVRAEKPVPVPAAGTAAPATLPVPAAGTAAPAARAAAPATGPDSRAGTKGECRIENNLLRTGDDGAVLVARLENPPRTRVVLAIDGPGGLNRELVWDPTVGDGLQHDVLLPRGDYRLMAFADDDRLQTSQALMITSTRFFTLEDARRAAVDVAKERTGEALKSGTALMGSSVRTLVVGSDGQTSFVKYKNHPRPTNAAVTEDKASTNATGGSETLADDTFAYNTNNPRLSLTCDDGRVELSRMRLSTKELQAGSVARGFLDQAAPTAVTDTLALIAEIAVERAKAGAMEIVKDRFVEPICKGLHLDLLGLGSKEELAFPRVCAMLRNMRVDDLLSSGRVLVEAARDDVRMTLLPELITKANMPAVAREVAHLALRLGNELLEGGGDESAALDLVMTQMDRILRIGAAAAFPALKQLFVDMALTETACQRAANETPEAQQRRHECLDEVRNRRIALIEATLQRVLPTDPGELLSRYAATPAQKKLAEALSLAGVKACERKKDTERFFVSADKSACIDALKQVLADSKDWQAVLKKVLGSEDGLISLLDHLRSRAGLSGYEEWLESTLEANLETIAKELEKSIPAPLETACALRVTVGVVKWCSNRDRCTAGDIATAIEKPENLFKKPENLDKPNTKLEKLCWNEKNELRLPIVRGPYVELASRALAFLTPPAKGAERERVIAVLRWMLDVAKAVDLRGGTGNAVQKIEEIVDLFARADYARAISQTLLVALEQRGCTARSCPVPDELEKALTLIGAVSSYVQVYDETKGKDPAEAKAARKKAIETLIDASTDRRTRAGKWIVSLGVPVGLTGAFRWKRGTDMDPDDGACFDEKRWDCAVAWRLPLGIALQQMAPQDGIRGVHFGLTFADLGNFARGKANGANETIEWSDFVQLGAQIGLTLGNRRHSLLLAVDASWSPGLYEREREVTNADGTTRMVTRSGAVLLGLTVAYYVPLFDFN